MIETVEQAEAVQLRRVRAGKPGVAKAVRRFYARQGRLSAVEHNVRRGQGGTNERKKLKPILKERAEGQEWKAQNYSMGGRRR